MSDINFDEAASNDELFKVNHLYDTFSVTFLNTELWLVFNDDDLGLSGEAFLEEGKVDELIDVLTAWKDWRNG